MKYATIWKTSYGYIVQWREVSDLSEQQMPTLEIKYSTRTDAKRAIAMSGAKLWN